MDKIDVKKAIKKMCPEKDVCHCSLCKQSRKYKKAKKEKDIDALIEIIDDLRDFQYNVGDDVAYYKAVIDGSWPQSEEILEECILRIKTAKEKEIKELINNWEEETKFDSSPATDNKNFKNLVNIAEESKKDKERVIEISLNLLNNKDLKYIRPLMLLSHIVPKYEQPIIDKSIQGKIEEQIDVWLNWGEENSVIYAY